MKWITGLLCMVLTTGVLAEAGEFSATAEKIKAALVDGRRSEVDKARDVERNPLQTLAFFRFRDDMTVLELVPGYGWYTQILAPVLEQKGKLYMALGAERAHDAVKGKPGFGAVELVPFPATRFIRTPGVKRAGLPALDFGLKSQVDLAVTFRNMHNFNDEGRQRIHQEVFKSLKPGGLYGILDHTRRHMQEDSTEVWRRMDPVQIIKEVQAAGFELVDYSTLHYRPDDELRYEVGRKTVTGNTDRFTLLFKKPS